MKPIETEYRGYRFRSRLEARWAVFFDHLGVTWKYETQGYLIGDGERPYLPDFWVPDFSAWVEVKGDPAALDLTLTDDAVSSLKGLPGTDPWGCRNILILGDIPDPGEPFGWLHRMVWRHAGACDMLCPCSSAYCSTVAFGHVSERMADEIEKKLTAEGKLGKPGDGVLPRSEWPRANLLQVGHDEMFSPRYPSTRDLVTAQPCGWLRPDPVVSAAYRAARSARFEHGESPAEPPRPEAREPKPVSEVLEGRLAEILKARKRDEQQP